MIAVYDFSDCLRFSRTNGHRSCLVANWMRSPLFSFILMAYSTSFFSGLVRYMLALFHLPWRTNVKKVLYAFLSR